MAHLAFADFHLDGTANDATLNPEKLTVVSEKATSRPIIVIPANESYEIAKHVMKVMG
jgi:acetate kinase